jgi:AcrR family transcriptional regulator
MHKNTEDRRAKRSRRMLKESLLALMQEKNFQEISARDVTDRADLNRGTFYLHYPDTQALLESIENDIASEIQELIDQHKDELRAGPSLQPVLLPLLDYIEEKWDIIGLLLRNTNTGSFLSKMNGLIYQNGMDYTKDVFPDRDPERQKYFLSFISFGLIGMVQIWAGEGMSFSKEKLIAYTDAMIQKAARAEF